MPAFGAGRGALYWPDGFDGVRLVSERIAVAVVDDDPEVREMLGDYLEGQGYDVLLADSAGAARRMLDGSTPRVMLLDVGLPGEDGLSLARFVRERYDIGIIMVSGAGETVDRIIGLEIGADDYIAKPFDLRELKARLKSVLRRYGDDRPAAAPPAAADEPAGRRIAIGDVLLDLDSRQLFGAGGDEIPLTRLEFDLLAVLVQRPNRPLTRDQLMNLTRNRDWDPLDRSLDIRVARLRRKVEPDPERPRHIRTVRGLGYMYVP